MVEVSQQILGWCWDHRRAIIAAVIVLALVTPRPAQAQFGLPIVGIIVGALNAINTALVNVIGNQNSWGISTLQLTMAIYAHQYGPETRFKKANRS